MRSTLSLLALSLAITLAGCQSNSTSLTSTAEKSQAATPGGGIPAAAPAKPLTPAEVNLTIGDQKKFAELLAAQQGKVILVDYWATWCGPCVESFPHTVATSKKYKDRGLATIAVNFDLLEDEPKVREFLAQKGADFTNLMSNYDDIGQDVATAFEWSELPEFRLYDRTGKLRHEWTAKPEDLDQRIEELLAE